MKKQFQSLKLFLPALLMIISLSSHAQQEFTLTTTNANIISHRALIDMPGLSGNTLAIIVVTPLGNTKALNPNPTGAWYYSGKWNLFNSNSKVLIPGLTYKVQYFLSPGSHQFLHIVTEQNLGSEGSYIDNPALNNNPNVQFNFLQNHSPDVRSGYNLNRFEEKAGYNAAAGRWYITNTGGEPLGKGSAYNIVISSSTGTTGSTTNPVGNSSTDPCNCPASLPPNGPATGDLTGTYPAPMVQKLLGRPLSNTAPVIGQFLKWNGTEWTPANASGNTGNSTTYTPGLGITFNGTEISAAATTPMWNAFQILGRDIMITPPNVGQVLKWGGAAWVPSDDNVGTGGTSNPEIWKSAGATISNTNTGNVGIGNNNPAYQLDISNRIRLRSGGNNSVSAGLWLNNNANTEAAFIGMEDDTHVGFFGMAGAGWKFAMNTQTGALKINGSEGTAGQVLSSNGAGSPPAWKQPGEGTLIKTYYKYPSTVQGQMEADGAATETKIPSISGIIITVTVPSTLAISASCYARANCPSVGSCPLSIEFYYKVNNNAVHPFAFSGAEYLTGTISNHFYDVGPGTYTIDFYSRKRSYHNELNYSAAGGYATVMVLPK